MICFLFSVQRYCTAARPFCRVMPTGRKRIVLHEKTSKNKKNIRHFNCYKKEIRYLCN